MKQFFSLGMCAILIFNSCATIISGGGKKDVFIGSTPTNANFRVIDERGKLVYEGITPKVLALKAGGDAYLKMKRYEVRFTKEGYYPTSNMIYGQFNPWYLGNLCIGGLIGMLLVDPLTGSMFMIENNKITGVLNPSSSNQSIPASLPITEPNTNQTATPVSALVTDTIKKTTAIVQDSMSTKK
jgi:hypothetical protein